MIYILSFFTLLFLFNGCGEAGTSSSAEAASSHAISSFGNNGYVLYHETDNTSESLQSIVLDNQDNIYACGILRYDDLQKDKMLLVKYTKNGDLYTNYASGGVFHSNNTTGYDRGYDVGINKSDTHDNIIVAGTTQNSSSEIRYSMTLWRLDRFGEEKSTFGNNGIVIDPLLSRSSAQQLLVDKNYNIFVLGTTYYKFQTEFFIWKLDQNGVLDTSFGNGNSGSGIISLKFDNIYGDIEYGKMAFDSNENIIFVGTVIQNDGSHIIILRYDRDGKLDKTFATDGVYYDTRAFTECAQDSKGVQAIALSKYDKIVVIGGTCHDGKMDMLAWQYKADGTPDQSFGDQGKIELSAEANSRIVWNDVLVDMSGNIIITGDTFYFGSTSHGQHMSLWKFDHTGYVRSDFGNNGKIVDNQTECYGKSLVFDSNRNLVVGGSCRGFAIWKYRN